MQVALSHRTFFLLGLLLIAIGLSLSPALMSIGQGVLVLNWLIEGEFKSKAQSITSNRYLLAFLSIIGIHLLGLLYTSNFEYALKDLKIKLPLLLIPIVLASTKKLEQKELKILCYTLLFSVLASSLYSFSIYLQIDHSRVDTLRNISPIISHIRFSLIICVCFFVLLYLIFTSDEGTWHWKNILWMGMALWFFIFIGILGARAGYLALIVCIGATVLYQVIVAKKWMYIAVFFIAIIALPLAMYQFSPSVKQRINEVQYEVNHYKAGGNPSGHSITQRFEYWKIAKHIISQNPLLGVGTGDIDDAFKNYYAQNETPIKKEYQFRSHNQYLSIASTFGILGLLIFLVALLYPYFVGIESYAFLPSVFIIITMLSMLTEDTLETQAGATYVAYFYSLFLFSAFRKNTSL